MTGNMYRSNHVDQAVFGPPGTPGVPGNRGAFARFFKVPVKNWPKSEAAGSDIFQEEVHVQILMPGDSLSSPVRRVRVADGTLVGKEWTTGFPREWGLFEEGRDQTPDGTSLSEWPPCTISLQATLKAIHIHTVEMLAEANEAALDRLGMDARKLQAKARAFLDTRRDTAAAMRHAAEAETARAAMVKMTDEMADMRRQLELITRSGQIMAGASVATQVAPPAAAAIVTPMDEMSMAAVAAGGTPMGDIDLSRLTMPAKRGVGRPPNQK